jgi:hypothetical protein
LVSGKVNDDFRLSSSDSSKGEIIGSTDISEIYLKDKTFSDWKELFLKLSENSKLGFNEREENDNLFLLKVADFGENSFDAIHQVLNMDIYDIKGQSITIEIRYTPKNKKLIEQLENMNRLKRYPFMLLSKVYTGDEKLIAVPITAYYEKGKIVNLNI